MVNKGFKRLHSRFFTMEKIPSNNNTLSTMALLIIMLLLYSCKNAHGLSFTATPDGVVIGATGTLTLACFFTESDVSQVYNIKIKRVIAPGSTTDELVASFVSGTATLDDSIIDDKGFSVTGDLNGASTKIELSMDISKLTCSDARMYMCVIGYDSTITGKIQTVTSNLTLETLVLPQMMPPLQARRNGNFEEGETDIGVFEVGDQLELECRANIGSIDSTLIRWRWRKTSEKDSSQFIDYTPPEGSYDEGKPLYDNQCGYTRTAVIRYTVTTPIAAYDLAFECYVSVSDYPPSPLTPSGVYTTDNNPRYYVDVLRVTTQPSTAWNTTQSTADAVSTCASSTNLAALVGVAVGSVIATLTVVGIILVVIKCIRMEKGKKKEREAGISLDNATTDTHQVYINEEQIPVSNLHHDAPVEYEDLQQSAREPNNYSDLRREH